MASKLESFVGLANPLHWYTNWLPLDIESAQHYQLDKYPSCRLVLFQEDSHSPLTT